MGLRSVVAVDDSRNELNLGGMILVAKRGDIDIYLPNDSSLIPAVRLQRADLDDIIAFLMRARKDKI